MVVSDTIAAGLLPARVADAAGSEPEIAETDDDEMPDLTKRRWWRRLQVAGLKAGQRVQRIYDMLGVEVSEIISLSFALAWALPLLLNPAYLTSTPRLANIAEHIPYPASLGVTLSLFLYQAVTLVLGGLPSAFIDDARSHRHWRQCRRLGLKLGTFFWWFLAWLLTNEGISSGTIFHGMAGLACAVGVWRFNLLMKVDEEYEGLKRVCAQVQAEIDAQSKEGGAAATTAVPGCL